MQKYWKHVGWSDRSETTNLIQKREYKWKLKILEIKQWNIEAINQYETLKARNFQENWRRLKPK